MEKNKSSQVLGAKVPMSKQVLALPEHLTHPNALLSRSLASLSSSTTLTKGELLNTRPDSSFLRKGLLHKTRSEFNIAQSLSTTSLPHFQHSLISQVTEASSEVEGPHKIKTAGYGSDEDYEDSIADSPRPHSRMSTHSLQSEADMRSLPSNVTESASNALFKPTDDRSIDIYIEELLKESPSAPSPNPHQQPNTHPHPPALQPPLLTRVTYLTDAEAALQYEVLANNLSGFVFSSSRVRVHEVNFQLIEHIIYRESLLEKMRTHMQAIDTKYWQYCVVRIGLVEQGKSVMHEALVTRRNELFQMQHKLAVEIAHLRSVSMAVLEGVLKLRALVQQELQFSEGAAVSVHWKGVNYVLKMSSDYQIMDEFPSIRHWLGFVPNPLMVPPPAPEHQPLQQWKLRVGLLFTHWVQTHRDKVNRDKKGLRHRRGFIVQDNKFILDNLQLLIEMEKHTDHSRSSTPGTAAHSPAPQTPSNTAAHTPLPASMPLFPAAAAAPKTFEPWEQLRDYTAYSWGEVSDPPPAFLAKRFYLNPSLPMFSPPRLCWQSEECAPLFWNNPAHNPYVVEAAVGFVEVFPSLFLVPPLAAALQSRCLELMQLLAQERQLAGQVISKRLDADKSRRVFDRKLEQPSVLEVEADAQLRDELRQRALGEGGAVEGVSLPYLACLAHNAYKPEHQQQDVHTFIVRRQQGQEPTGANGSVAQEEEGALGVGEHIFSLTHTHTQSNINTPHPTASTLPAASRGNSGIGRRRAGVLAEEDEERDDSTSQSFNVFEARDSVASARTATTTASGSEDNSRRAPPPPQESAATLPMALPASPSMSSSRLSAAHPLAQAFSIVSADSAATLYPTFVLDRGGKVRERLRGKVDKARGVICTTAVPNPLGPEHVYAHQFQQSASMDSLPSWGGGRRESTIDEEGEDNDNDEENDDFAQDRDDMSHDRSVGKEDRAAPPRPPMLPRSLSISRIAPALSRMNTASSLDSQEESRSSAHPHALPHGSPPRLSRSNTATSKAAGPPALMRGASFTAASAGPPALMRGASFTAGPGMLTRAASFARQPSFRSDAGALSAAGGGSSSVHSDASNNNNTLLVKTVKAERRTQREMNRLDARWNHMHAVRIQRLVRRFLARMKVRRLRRKRKWRRCVWKIRGAVRGFLTRLQEQRREQEQRIEVFMLRKDAYRRFLAAIVVTRYLRRVVNLRRLKKAEPLLYDKLDDRGRPLSRKASQNRLRASIRASWQGGMLESVRRDVLASLGFLPNSAGEGPDRDADSPPLGFSPLPSRGGETRKSLSPITLFPPEQSADQGSVGSAQDNHSLASSTAFNHEGAGAEEGSQASWDEFAHQQQLLTNARRLVRKVQEEGGADVAAGAGLRGCSIIPYSQSPQSVRGGNVKPRPRFATKERVFLAPARIEGSDSLVGGLEGGSSASASIGMTEASSLSPPGPSSTVASTFDVYRPPRTFLKLNKKKDNTSAGGTTPAAAATPAAAPTGTAPAVAESSKLKSASTEANRSGSRGRSPFQSAREELRGNRNKKMEKEAREAQRLHSTLKSIFH